jgi:hypothetical protein
MAGYVTEECAGLAGRVGVAVQGATVEEGDAAARFEFEHEAQKRGGGRCTVAEQAGDLPGAGFEGGVVDEGR